MPVDDSVLDNQEAKELITDVVRHVRRQSYTPATLCELQKIIETKYYYWWIMDLKKEEYAVELFDEEFSCFHNGYPIAKTSKRQALNSKWVNAPMTTMHMGHQPLVWLIDDSHARGVFQYEDHQVYKEDGFTVQTWMVYCDDFTKDSGGVWHIKTMRMYEKQADGQYRNPMPPKGWQPEKWETD